MSVVLTVLPQVSLLFAGAGIMMFGVLLHTGFVILLSVRFLSEDFLLARPGGLVAT
jgi:hypothetical protein